LVDHVAQVERQKNRKHQQIPSDGGGECMNNEFKHFVQRKGRIHEVTPPYTPEYNEVIEPRQRSINERIRTYAFEGKLH
jgi:hypothetical protein